MREAIIQYTTRVLTVLAITLSAGVAGAEAGEATEQGGESDAYTFGLAFTIGEGVYFIDSEAYRGPVSLELVPSFGWDWFKFDFGVSMTLESIRVGGTNVGNWNFTFRPGARLTPPSFPMYLRFAVPLVIRLHDFDYGLMFGVGADIPLADFRAAGVLGFVIEVDTTVSNDLAWGGDGVPLEFRIGLSLHF